jgi:nucleoside-diphosphate-sugar epimerase
MDLVTGGTGIVGVHMLNELLAQGRPVRALVRAGSDRELVRKVLKHYHADGDARFARIAWAEGDLLEMASLSDALAGVQRVFHCAAIVSFDPRDADAMFKHNITGTANVVNAMLEAGVPKLCHVSSTATIGSLPNGAANDESVQFVSDKHSSPYAVSKHEAEMEVQRGIAEGLFGVLVNPCIVLGPGAEGRSSMPMVERVRKGSRFYPPGSNAVVDARDVASAMVQLMEKGASGERHLLIGENLGYERLFSIIAKTAGKDAPTWPLRPWMLELGWRLERVRTLFGANPLITRHTARTAYRPRLYEGSKARSMGLTFRDASEAVRNVEDFLRAQ